MGCYDEINVPCPQCGKRQEVQSKGGAGMCMLYELEDCPPDVLSDANRHAPYYCECGATFCVEVEIKAVGKTKLL